jgi:hypothetical protein
MALTKSLHTVTAATNVARLIYNVDRGQGVMTGAELASKALKALGQALDGSETSQRIIANCKAIIGLDG